MSSSQETPRTIFLTQGVNPLSDAAVEAVQESLEEEDLIPEETRLLADDDDTQMIADRLFNAGPLYSPAHYEQPEIDLSPPLIPHPIPRGFARSYRGRGIPHNWLQRVNRREAQARGVHRALMNWSSTQQVDESQYIAGYRLGAQVTYVDMVELVNGVVTERKVLEEAFTKQRARLEETRLALVKARDKLFEERKANLELRKELRYANRKRKRDWDDEGGPSGGSKHRVITDLSE